MCLKSIFCKNCKERNTVAKFNFPQAVEKTLEMAYRVLRGEDLSDEEKQELIERLLRNRVILHVGDVKLVSLFGQRLIGEDFEKSFLVVDDESYEICLDDKVLFQYVVDSGIKKNYVFITTDNRIDRVVLVK